MSDKHTRSQGNKQEKKAVEEYTKEEWQRWYAHKSNKEMVIEEEEYEKYNTR